LAQLLRAATTCTLAPFSNPENCIPMLETKNWSYPRTFRGNGFCSVGNGLLDFPTLEIDFDWEFLRTLGKALSGCGNSKSYPLDFIVALKTDKGTLSGYFPFFIPEGHLLPLH